MNEEFLHFVWKYRLYDTDSLRTPEGDPVEVLRSGEPNTDAGPDFLNCRIRIRDTQWAGNAEIHLRSSDWIRHNHQNDKAYDNVILHLVHLHDTLVKNSSGEEVPTFILKCDDRLLQNYHSLRTNQSWAACEKQLPSVDPFFVNQWLARMMVERLELRSEQVIGILEETGGDWQEVCYRMVFASLGMKVNTPPFELLARRLPYKLLLKHRDQPLQLEALLFGTAGFLENQLFEDTYYSNLRKEYEFLKKKYKLKPIDTHLWKMLRLRPGNFPAVRIAQAASLINKGLLDFSSLISRDRPSLLAGLLETSGSDYWDSHFQFHKESRRYPKRIGADAAVLILINALIPVLFTWASRNKDQEMINYTLNQLEILPAEDNSIIRHWDVRGLKARHAFDSQALIQLRNQYCIPRYCLRCAIGTQMVTRLESNQGENDQRG
jgi:hypothetical protein